MTPRVPEPAQPDGAAAHVRAAAEWSPWLVIVPAVGLGLFFHTAFPLVLCLVLAAWSAWQATRPLEGAAPARLGWRRLARGLIPLASLGSLLLLVRHFGGQSLPYGDLYGLVGLDAAWLAFVVAFWGHLASLTRPGSAPRRAVHLRGAALATAAAGLMGVALYAGWGALTAGEASGQFLKLLYWDALATVAAAVLSPALLQQAMAPFRKAPSLAWRYPEALVKALEAEGLPARAVPGGVLAEEAAPAGAPRLRIDLQRIPAQAAITVSLTEGNGPLSRIAVRARRRGEEGGVDLSDPLLRGALFVEGAAPEEARALLAGLHEPLLAVFHAHPAATLREGRLTVAFDGPPFAPGQSEVESAQFLSARLAECARLAEALRRQPTRAPASEPSRARRTPTPTREG